MATLTLRTMGNERMGFFGVNKDGIFLGPWPTQPIAELASEGALFRAFVESMKHARAHGDEQAAQRTRERAIKALRQQYRQD